MSTGDRTGRTVNAKRNIAYGTLQVVLSQLLPFVVRTILIYRFGVEYLGLNSLFASVLSVLSLMELGFGTAIVYSMYRPVAEKDTDEVCAYLSYYRKIYRVIGLAVLSIGLLLMHLLPLLVRDPTPPGGLNLYGCFLIFLGNSVISYLLYGYMTAIPTACQRRDILSRVDMGMSLLKCAVQSAVLLSSRNFYLYLFSIPMITVLRNLLIARIVRKRYPSYVCKGELSAEKKHDLNKRVYGLFIDKVTGVSRNSIDSLCISAMIGLAVTGMYNNYYFILAALVSFSAMICRSIIPGVGNSIAVESREKNYADMRRFDFLYMAAAGWAAACLLCLYQPFMFVWVGESMMLGMPVVLGLCVYFYILRTGDIRWVYHEGAGLWWEGRYIMLGEAASNITLNILLCRKLGVAGIVLATVLSVFVTNCVFYPALLFRVYFRNGKLREYWQDHLWYTLTAILTAAASWGICEKLMPIRLVLDRTFSSCIICLGGRLLICTFLSMTMFWLIWHRSERYKQSVAWMKKMLRV